MIGCHVDKARTGVRGDMLGSDEGAGLGEEALEFVHRMASNRSGQLGAFTRPDNLFIGDGQISASGQSRDQVFRPKNRSEEHTTELQSLMRTSYSVFSLNTKTTT